MKRAVPFLVPIILFAASIQASTNETLSDFTDQFPNIVMGEVYYVTGTSFLLSVDLEFKGNMVQSTFEVVIDGTGLKPEDIKVGRKVLLFVNKLRMNPIENLPFASFHLSKFDKFHGQCAFRFINSELDNDFLSQLTNVMYQKQFAAVYTY